MAESGLRPVESLLNNRSRHYVLRLMSLPKRDQAKSLPGCDTAMGQRMVHFSEYSGRVEEMFLPEDGSPSPTRNGRSMGQGERTPNQGWCSGGRVLGRERGGGVRGRKAHMGFFQEAYGVECAAIACALAAAAERAKRRKLGRVRNFTDVQADGSRRARAGPDLRHEEGDSSAARVGAFCRDRDPLLPRAQRDPRERDRGRMSQAVCQRAG